MPVDNVVTSQNAATRLFCCTIRRLNAHQSKLYLRHWPASAALTSWLDTTTHVNMHVGAVSLHTPAMRAWDRKPNFLSAVQAGTVQRPHRRCVTGTPAARGLLSIPRVLRFGRPWPPSVYKNNLSPIQFVLVQYLIYQMHSHYKNLV